ncbi:hypothetical protein NY2A_b673R [Paramecium bursaria Chlorella virus NY2A]|uniref:Uncharacterized protein b673R n=1 Tax=Paramecium bursaria Chlorella virus NY2A TaxID=46021 RepID=A7IXJ8_PBCVN|nr:hypothetical protein NY2A_b673R [Paramecium bursaria Chlorella virus NY2A]ABT15072.1 hypothetical protein NY2A_b673R [Paramecium bursaria Chlorella virus NY2A]
MCMCHHEFIPFENKVIHVLRDGRFYVINIRIFRYSLSFMRSDRCICDIWRIYMSDQDPTHTFLELVSSTSR